MLSWEVSPFPSLIIVEYIILEWNLELLTLCLDVFHAMSATFGWYAYLSLS